MTTDLNWLWGELRYHQEMNRVTETTLRKGRQRVKQLAAAIRTYDRRRASRARRRVT